MIFTDRTIIVQKGTSSINDTIILYRGDKGVEIRFTLNEGSPFRFGSGASPNIIEKTEAAYGQLIIKRPNDLPAVFSEIAPTNEGKIVFTITAEMIDEITEVGNYTFQIRLFDESMNSRATLPEVVDGIEIREPIAAEDVTDTNEVDIATVGYALTTAGTTEDTFDSQGNYNKTTWGTGERITAAKLNKMETGIDEVNKKIASAGTSGGNLVTDEQIATAVSNYLRENPIDGTVDTVVETIPDNNLFDKNNLVTSFTNKDGGTVTGNFTNYIKLKAGQKYVTNLNHTQYYFFDKSKQHVSTQTYLDDPQIFNGNGGYVLIKLPSNYTNSVVLEGTDIGAHKPQHIKLRSSLEDNKWYGKKWLLIGDSISTDENIYAKDGYGKLISRDLGMTLTNIAVTGKTMAWGYEQLDSLCNEFDLITVMLGTNNQGYSCTIGALNDTYYQAGTYNTNNSFYAQTQLMIEKLMTKFPKSKIIFLTPIKRTGCGDDAGYNDENGYFKKLATTKEYRDVIIDCCNYYSIPYIDLYNCIDPRTEVNRKLYFIKADGSDGTHPNDLGHALFLAPVIKNGIIKECPYYFNQWIIAETHGDIVTNVSNLSINEGGTGTFTVSLSVVPTNDQVVSLSSNNTDITVSPNSLTFTSENYGTAQTVTVSAAEDSDTTNDTATITLSSNKVVNKTVSITVADNDTPAVTPTTYTITNNLTNCTNSNNTVSIEENASYTATLTANDGYTLDSPVITIGGADVTNTVYNGGNINITSVTGNVVITCSATANSSSGGGDTASVLLHSWNLSDGGTIVGNDTIYEDTVNDFDLIKSGNDRYKSPGKLLLGRTDSFTIILEDVTPTSVYYDFILHTGVTGGIHVSETNQTEAPYTLGRFKLQRNQSYGGYNGELKIERINTDKQGSTDTYTTTQGMAKGSINNIKITYDANTTTGKIYLNDELVQTIEKSLLIDGIYFNTNKERFTIGNIKLYRGIV